MKKLHLILILSMIYFTVSGFTIKKSNSLNGTWKPVKLEIAGNALDESTFQNQSLVILDSTYVFTAESIDKGVCTFGDGKMDIYGKDGVNAGKHFTAIYKLENGQLTICYNLAGDSYPTNFETKSKPTLFMAVFKKE